MENEHLVISKIEAVLMRLKYELAAIKTVVAVKDILGGSMQNTIRNNRGFLEVNLVADSGPEILTAQKSVIH